MDELTAAREQIEIIDAEMARLFCARMAQSRIIGQYKTRQGLPIKAPEREEQLIERNCGGLSDETLTPYYREFLRAVIHISCAYQEKLREEEK